MFFSLLGREFRYRYRMGPGDLPEALVPCRCPVSGALQLIRHETLAAVGLYDEGFWHRLGGRRLLPARVRRRARVHLRARRARAVHHGRAAGDDDPRDAGAPRRSRRATC